MSYGEITREEKEAPSTEGGSRCPHPLAHLTLLPFDSTFYVFFFRHNVMSLEDRLGSSGFVSGLWSRGWFLPCLPLLLLLPFFRRATAWIDDKLNSSISRSLSCKLRAFESSASPMWTVLCTPLFVVDVAERLRQRLAAKPLGFARVGSNFMVYANMELLVYERVPIYVTAFSPLPKVLFFRAM